jgi:hypothetical protein
MLESRNKGVILWATDKSIYIVTTRQTVIFVATTIRLHDNPTVRLGVPYSVAKNCLKRVTGKLGISKGKTDADTDRESKESSSTKR